ncbi:amidohydrolase family protein [Pseudonocardia adelaidensis]|uniref:Amidohydrolase-related domain-containing protein n=1 Tax=Pseudonocardia adelaidensis TaxID=648754 RepID=A0ABP9NF39_9PSEU
MTDLRDDDQDDEQVDGQAIDALALLGPNRYAPELTWPALRDTCRALGVGRVVVAPPLPPDRDLARAGRRLVSLAESTAADPVRAIPLARVDPWEPSAAADAAELLDSGARGVLVHPWEDNFRINDVGLLTPLLHELRAAGAPLVVEAGFPWVAEPAQLADLARRFPSVPVVATRGGHMNMSGLSGAAMLAALRQAANLHVLTSGVYRQDWLEQVVGAVGADRVAYASHAPVFDPRLEFLRPRALPEPATRQAVLAATATRLFER